MLHGRRDEGSRRIGRALIVALAAAAAAAPAPGNGPPDDVRERVNGRLGLWRSDVATLHAPADATAVALVPVPESVAPHLLNGMGLMLLEPHSVRAPGYRILVQQPDGSLEPAPPRPVRTMQGTILGIPGSRVAATMDDDGMRAKILLPTQEVYWLEPLGAHEPGAAADQCVVYSSDDVAAGGESCGTGQGGDGTDKHSLSVAPEAGHGLPVAPEAPPVSAAGAGSVSVAELAADADFEYFQAYGSVAAVEDRINAVINAVNIQYERDVGIRHEISTIIVRTSEPDPYTTTDSADLLNEFTTHWQSNHGAVQRDVAQLFTGKDLDSNIIGRAWLSAVCSSYGYSVVQSDFSTNFAAVTDLSAHELGHNWGADHCSCSNPGYTMNPSLTTANEFHPTSTIPEIMAFRDSRGCLDAAGTAPAAPSSLVATDLSSSQIELAWVDNADDEDGFEVEQSFDGAGWTVVAATGPNVTGWTDTGLPASTTSYYRVLGFNGDGDSAYTNVAGATTDDPPPPPPSPVEATLTDVVVVQGDWLAGGVPQLEASDDDDVAVAAVQQGPRFKTTTHVKATSPHATVSRMDVTVERGADNAAVRTVVFIYNYNRMLWKRLGAFYEPPGDTELVFEDLPLPNRFIHEATGMVRVRVATISTAGDTPNGYTTRLDRVRIEVTP